MAKQQDKEVLDFGIGVDIRDALKAIEKYQRQMAKSMKAVADSGEKMGKATGKGAKKAREETEALADAVGDVGKAYEDEAGAVSNLTKTIRELSVLAKNSTGDEKKALQAQIKALKKVDTERKKLGGGAAAPPKGGLFFGRFTPEKVKKELAEAGEALKAPLEAFLNRDLKGVIEGSVKGAGAVLSRSLKFSKIMSGMGAEALGKRGEKASIKGKAMGGARGAATQMAGGGMKAMATVMGKMGGFLSMLSSLGPILSTVSGAVMGLITRFISADSMVKEFNKDIMQSASNLEIFEQSGRNADLAGAHLKETLSQLREAAFDYTTNLAYGITKDDHKAMLNTLTQEGITLGRIESEASMAGKSVKDLATQLTVTGVAYSRAFGVPLAEIGQLQAEMMTEMGRSLGETQQAFSLMTRGATESGIASNKFFASIRGFSQDLGLYNLRLEDSISLLGKMGKVMSPRNAQKFMQEAAQGLKSMGRQEKLRMTMFAGSAKTNAVMERDIKRKTDALVNSLAEKTGSSADDLRKAFESEGYSGIKSTIDKLPKEMQGAMADSAITLQLQRSQAGKGQYGTAMATSDLGIGGALELGQSSLMAFSKGQYKSITDALGSMGLESVAETLGKSDEQVKQMARLEIEINAQRKALIAAGAKASEINAMGYDEIIATMTEDMQKSLKGEKEGQSIDERMEAMARKQGQLTQSLADKLQVLVDWFMNQFYEVVMGIWETVMGIPGLGNDAQREQLAALRRAKEHGSSELAGIASSGDISGGLAGSKVMTDFLKAVGSRDGLAKQGSALDSKIGKLESQLSGTNREDPQYKILAKQLEEAKTQREKTSELVDGINLLIKEATRFDADALADALTMDTGFSFGGGTMNQGLQNRAKFKENVGKVGYEEAARLAGASSQQATTGLGKLAYTKQGAGRKVDNFGRVGKGLEKLGLGGGTAGASTGAPLQEVAASTTETAETLATVAATNQQVHEDLSQSGIKIDPVTTKTIASDSEKAMLAALRTALFEYYLYSGTDRGTLLAAMSKGGMTDPTGMASFFGGASVQGSSTLSALEGLSSGKGLTANAAGGVVTGVSNGMALVAARGEGLASVGRGERIVPSGAGGGTNVSVTVNGIGGRDLANLIEGKVVDGIRDYKRREKFY